MDCLICCMQIEWMFVVVLYFKVLGSSEAKEFPKDKIKLKDSILHIRRHFSYVS